MTFWAAACGSAFGVTVVMAFRTFWRIEKATRRRIRAIGRVKENS